jgi:hypothetical protein
MRSARVTTVLTVGALFVLAPAAADAATRYASPNPGAMADCLTPATACSLTSAVDNAGTGDEVVVLAGTYILMGPIETSALASGVTIHGAAGSRPVIMSTHGEIGVQGPNQTLSDVEIDQTSANTMVTGLRLNPTDTAENVLVVEEATGAVGVAGTGGAPGGLLRDSVVQVPAAGAAGAGTERSDPLLGAGGALQLVNDTVVAKGSGSDAVTAASTCSFIPPANRCGTGDVSLVNVIARGGPGGHDAVATTATTTTYVPSGCIPGIDNPCTMETISSTSTLHENHSDLRPAQINLGTPPTNGTLDDQGGNISADSAFTDLAAGDFHEVAGSPTIDAGIATALLGPADPDGNPRTLGAAPDIGAFEFVPPPPAPKPAGGGSTAPPGPPSGGPPTGGTHGVGGANTNVGPVIRNAALTVRRFAVARQATAVSATAKGTILTYALSENAVVTIEVLRLLPGHRRHGACVARMAKHPPPARCTRSSTAGALVRAQRAGAESLPFSGRIGRAALAPGRYELSLAALDAAGRRSSPVVLPFRIVSR